MSEFPRGSEWRRWDLHVHTPHSSLNNRFGVTFEEYASRLIETAARQQVAAVGVTDYFSIQGYRQLRRLLTDEAWLRGLSQAAREHLETLLLLPNVEMRGFVIGGEEHRDSRVNYHIIFSNEVSADEIDEHFLSRLTFTASAGPGRPDERWSLTDANLAELGTRLKEQHERFRDPPVVVGMMSAVVDHEEASRLLVEQPSRFEGRYLLVAPIDEDLAHLGWDGQGHLTRKLFIQKSDMIFSSNPGTREFVLGRRHNSVDEYLAEFASLKPCIHGSDAHDFEHLFEPDERRYNWIKADPTWRGLAMLLNEPEDRVFIGPFPPQLQAFGARRAKTMTETRVGRSPGATTAEVWFNNDVPLNPGICAIIGNRGNGKSALAEIVGLVGDTQRASSFSFLGPDRFRHPRIGKADQFQATVDWGDGTRQGPRRLSENPPTTAIERVRYIGQGFLEAICNEIDEGEGSRFYQELQEVIFSHVAEPDRQGHATLDSLLSALGEGIDQELAALREEVRTLNRRILELLDRIDPSYRDRLDAELAELSRQFHALDGTRPAAPTQPPEEPETEEGKQLLSDLAALREREVMLEARRLQLGREDTDAAVRQASAGRLLDRVRAVEAAVRGFRDEGAADAQTLGLDLDRVVQLIVNTRDIDELVVTLRNRRAEIARDLDPLQPGTAADLATTKTAIATAEELLSRPQREYQASLAATAAWEAARNVLLGEPTSQNTIRGKEAQIEALAGVPAAIGELVARRKEKVREIYSAKSRLRNQFETLHRPVSTFLESSAVAATEAFKLQFAAQVVEAGFADSILSMIDQRRVGAFAGVEEGRSQIDALLAATDWSDEAQAIEFPDAILALLTPADEKAAARIRGQLRRGASSQDLVDYLYSLEYLAPTYKLTWDDRAVSELSPGERGNLLLIFYLLVDRNDIPLVIDQPEENLDNQTVYKTLVPCMRDARSRRQIIVVTHNPNLAVVCDAEQVIYAEIHKDAGNAVSYETGAIEDPIMNRRLIDVLEGTEPAFSQRAAKYLLA